ncbi:hypothetical protein MTO96_004119 [Rhipicephalus appendiculatus]
MIVQVLLSTLLLCAHGARALRPYEPLDEDSNSGIPAVHAAPAFGDGKTPQDDVPTQEDDMMENGNMPLTRQQAYHFSYQIRDADGNSQHHNEQSDVRNNRRGSYGYRDANGLYRHVTYVADRKGFRAWIKTNEPGTTNQEPADVRITAEKPPQKVVDEATSRPAKPNVAADPADAIPCSTCGLSHSLLLLKHDTVPVHPVHTAGVVATPAVAAVPAFHVSAAGGYELSRPVAPVSAIDIATGAYPTLRTPTRPYQTPSLFTSPFVQFPTLSSSSEKGSADSGEVTQKHGIPVGVTYVNPQDVSRPFEQPQSFDIAPTGVASRYKKYLDWNRQGKLRD